MTHEITIPPCTIALRGDRNKKIRADVSIDKEDRQQWNQFARMHGGVNKGSGCYAFEAIDALELIEHAAQCGAQVIPGRGVAAVLEVAAELIGQKLDALDMQIERLPHPLRPYQRDGAEFLATRNLAHLYDDMGLGKTIQVLAALPAGVPVVVVCPASMRLTWATEGQKWRPDIEWTTIEKLDDVRPPKPGEAVVLSPTAITMRDMVPEPGTHMVCDEAHYFKNSKAARTQAIAKLGSQCVASWALTGTPQTNDPKDLQGLLTAFGVFHRAFGSVHCFDECHGAEWDQKARKVVWPSLPPHPGAIVQALERVAIRRTREEVLGEIPAMQYATIMVDIRGDASIEMPSDADLADYRELVEAIDHGGLETVPRSVMANVGRAREKLARAKIAHMMAFIDHHLDTPHSLVVACSNTAPLRAMYDAGYPVITGNVSAQDRQRHVEDFQASRTRIIGLNIKAAGVGITLTRAHHMLMVQREWSPSDNEQVEARIRRYGQKSSCIVYDMIANHPLDENISQALRDKQDRIDATVNKVSSSIRYGRNLQHRLMEISTYAQKNKQENK